MKKQKRKNRKNRKRQPIKRLFIKMILQNDIYIRNDNDDNNNNDSNDNTNNNKKVLIISKLFSVFIKTEKKKSFE